MARSRLQPFLAALMVVIATASPATAQLSGAEAKAAAEALFDEGRKLRADGKFLEAAEKFEQSQKLDPGIGTLLRLADCYEQAGKLASAWANFRHAASMANARSDTRRAKIAEERIATLEPRLSKLTLELGENAWLDGITIRRNDATVDVATAGIAIPLDPRTYEIAVVAPGHRSWSTTVDLTAEGIDEVVVVPDLEPERAPAQPVQPTPQPSVEPPPAPAPVILPPESSTSTIHPANWVALGLGAGALLSTGIGIGLVVDALSLDGQADDFCDGTVCSDPRGQELSEQARVQANGATAAFVVAGVLAGGGLVTFLVTPTYLKVEPEISWAPFVVPGAGGRSSAGLVVKGAF